MTSLRAIAPELILKAATVGSFKALANAMNSISPKLSEGEKAKCADVFLKELAVQFDPQNIASLATSIQEVDRLENESSTH